MSKVKVVRQLIRGSRDISAKVRAGDMAGAAQEAAETALQVAVLVGAVALVPIIGPWAVALLEGVGVEATVELVVSAGTAAFALFSMKGGIRRVRRKIYDAAYSEPETLPGDDEEELIRLPDGTEVTMGWINASRGSPE